MWWLNLIGVNYSCRENRLAVFVHMSLDKTKWRWGTKIERGMKPNFENNLVCLLRLATWTRGRGKSREHRTGTPMNPITFAFDLRYWRLLNGSLAILSLLEHVRSTRELRMCHPYTVAGLRLRAPQMRQEASSTCTLFFLFPAALFFFSAVFIAERI